jgi:hypothetical protein
VFQHDLLLKAANQAGERHGRNRSPQVWTNPGSGAPKASTIAAQQMDRGPGLRPRVRPDALIAASALATISGMICNGSTPPCA